MKKYALLLCLLTGIYLLPQFSLAYYGTLDSDPYSPSSSLIKTGQIACFAEDPDDPLPCPFDFPSDSVIDSVDIYVNGFNPAVGSPSYVYCDDFSTWYYQTDASTTANFRLLNTAGNFFCGSRISAHVASGNWIINFTYFEATSTFSILGSASSSPIYTQDAGNLSIGLAILIVGMFLMVAGFIFNNMTSKKPWR